MRVEVIEPSIVKKKKKMLNESLMESDRDRLSLYYVQRLYYYIRHSVYIH